MRNLRGIHQFLRIAFAIYLSMGWFIYAKASPDGVAWAERDSQAKKFQNAQVRDAIKDCVSKEGDSANACNEDTSPFAQAAMGALQALMPLLMQNQGQKQDCNKVDAAQAQASSQMGQGMPGCGGGGGQPQAAHTGGQQPQQSGNNMASDCGKKSGDGKKSCADAKKRLSSIKQNCQQKQDQACVQEAQQAEKLAGDSEKANSKMGSVNIGQIMQMLGQMLCQMQKAQQCQKDVCAAPGQLKFDNTDPKMTAAVPGQSKVLTDDEGCLVDCNNMNYVSDPQYPQWAAKVNARIAKFKPQCECMKTPSLPGCGSITSPTATTGTPKKDKKDAKLTNDEETKSNASDKTLGDSGAGSGSVGAMGGGGAGISGSKSGGADGKKDPSRPGSPPGPPQVSSGYEGGGGSPSKSSGSSSDDPIGKYSKFLPGSRKPTASGDVGTQITGAGGKSIWEKVSDAYRDKAGSLTR